MRLHDVVRALTPNYHMQRTLPSAAKRSARAANKFARASLGRRHRGAADVGR